MSTPIFYRQCKLRRGDTHQTAFIPEKYAKEGKYLEIKGEDGWLVEKVHSFSATEQSLIQVIGRQYRWTRQVSDI